MDLHELRVALPEDPGQVEAGQLTLYNSSWAPSLPLILNVVTPQAGKVTFSLGLLSVLASLPSPLTIGGQASPFPLSHTAKGKINSISKLPVPLCHVWAKAAG